MRITIFKTVGERRIEGATWGLILVWIGAMMFWKDAPHGVPSLGAGSIMLASALLQKALGYEAGVVLWAAGLGLAISGLNDVLDEGPVHLSALGVVLVVVGVLIVVRSLGAGGRRHLRDVSHRPHDIDI